MKTVRSADSHSRWKRLSFEVRAAALRARRWTTDLSRGPRCWQPDPAVNLPFTVAEHRSPLWTETSVAERLLQLGKVQNLRAAARRLNGAVVPKGEMFSFWKQVGRATARRGFAVGRELREGCFIPTIGGGLCQLSNALYAAAHHAGCTIVERHPHSRAVPGSAAIAGQDATVAWNYIDLRFKPRETLRIEIEITAGELLVRFSAAHVASTHNPGIVHTGSRLALTVSERQPNSCVSCGAIDCSRHSSPLAVAAREPGVPGGRTAWLVDEVWPEYQHWMEREKHRSDILLAPVDGMRRGIARYAWNTAGFARVETATVQTLWRSWQARRLGSYGAARLAADLRHTGAAARALAERIPPDVTRVVAAQSMLPCLWTGGYLGGRRFDVLMTRRPLAEMRAALDTAAERWPERSTLREYRPPMEIEQAETRALAAADRIVTPHAYLAALFGDRAQRISWEMPAADSISGGECVVFPGPCVARKGAFEVRQAARSLGFTLLARGSALEGPEFWSGCKRVPSDAGAGAGWLSQAAVVVQPALIEDRPRALLRALATGIPVIATPECGVSHLPGVTEVPWGDVQALVKAIGQACPARHEI